MYPACSPRTICLVRLAFANIRSLYGPTLRILGVLVLEPLTLVSELIGHHPIAIPKSRRDTQSLERLTNERRKQRVAEPTWNRWVGPAVLGS